MPPTKTQGPISPLSPPEARRKSSSLKTWWHALTHRKDSKDDGGRDGDDGHGNGEEETTLHRLPYRPRHAKRDALLSVPLAERRRTPPLHNMNAVKRNSTGSLAVHPNRDISLDRLGRGNRRRHSWSWWESSGDGSGGSGSGGMESIREDDAPGEGDGGPASLLPPPPPSLPSAARLGSATYTSSSINNINDNVANGQASASSSSGSGHGNIPPYPDRVRHSRRQPRRERSDVARQLQDRISPAERAQGGADADADAVVASASSVPLPPSPSPAFTAETADEVVRGRDTANDEDEEPHGEGMDVDAWVKQLMRATAVM